MKLYRSISEKELTKLLREVDVRGQYDCAFEAQTESNLNNVCCFFTEDFRWDDNEHIFYLEIEVPDDRILEKSKARYWVPKNVLKTRVWTGRRGDELLEIEEAYLDSYNVADVKKIIGIHRKYAKWWYEKLVPLFEKYKIETDYK